LGFRRAIKGGSRDPTCSGGPHLWVPDGPGLDLSGLDLGVRRTPPSSPSAFESCVIIQGSLTPHNRGSSHLRARLAARRVLQVVRMKVDPLVTQASVTRSWVTRSSAVPHQRPLHRGLSPIYTARRPGRNRPRTRKRPHTRNHLHTTSRLHPKSSTNEDPGDRRGDTLL
jgi:hypothetical protein